MGGKEGQKVVQVAKGLAQRADGGAAGDGLPIQPFGLVRDFFPDDADYEEMFDWWEYLLSLSYVALTLSDSTLNDIQASQEYSLPLAPVGRYAWRANHGYCRIVEETQMQSGLELPEKVASAIQTRLFGNTQPASIERFRLVKGCFDSWLERACGHWI